DAFSVATTAEWLARLAGKIPVSPVYDVKQALDNPFVREQQRILEADHPVRGKIRTVACPIRCSDEPDRVGIAPTLGVDTEEVLTRLGYAGARIEQLRKDGVI
ncbi:MAG: CoA transferase, partial [Proteobacteria bacterium]|nr:CoA transferase [Pseudomonadota bacterium]